VGKIVSGGGGCRRGVVVDDVVTVNVGVSVEMEIHINIIILLLSVMGIRNEVDRVSMMCYMLVMHVWSSRIERGKG
jgi:hypothetical protein